MLPEKTSSTEKLLVSQISDLKLSDLARHLDEVNVDFKENIMKKVETIKLKDTHELQKRVDDIKREE
jgi:hypothetical protein